MDFITIHTGLEKFLMVDRITHITKDAISGEKAFSNAPAYLCLEALAQICALHVRHLNHFEKHAFLLKITGCTIHPDRCFSGSHILHGTLTSASSQAFSYTATAVMDGTKLMDGEFIIATRTYGKEFPKETIKPYYHQVFSCLHKNTQTN